MSQRSYFVWESDFNTVDTREYWRDLPRLAMRISDYNDMRGMAGMEPVWLAENEFFMHLDYEMDMERVADSIGSGNRSIQLDDGTILELADMAICNDPLGTYLFHHVDSILVFPDSVCENLHLARTCYYANTKKQSRTISVIRSGMKLQLLSRTAIRICLHNMKPSISLTGITPALLIRSAFGRRRIMMLL